LWSLTSTSTPPPRELKPCYPIPTNITNKNKGLSASLLIATLITSNQTAVSTLDRTIDSITQICRHWSRICCRWGCSSRIKSPLTLSLINLVDLLCLSCKIKTNTISLAKFTNNSKITNTNIVNHIRVVSIPKELEAEVMHKEEVKTVALDLLLPTGSNTSKTTISIQIQLISLNNQRSHQGVS